MKVINNTGAGGGGIGTKAPHKKLEPNATTFTIPFIAPLFDTKFPIKNAIVVAQIVNTREFIIYTTPVAVVIISPNIIKLIIT